MEAMADPDIRLVSVVAPVQSSKTISAELCLCYIIANFPGPCLWLSQTDADAKDQAEARLHKLFSECDAVKKALSRRQAQEENPDGFLFERNDPLGSRSPRQKQSPEPLDSLAHRRRNLAVAERAHAAGGSPRYGFRMARQVHFPLAGRNRKRRYPQEVRNDRHAGMGIQMSQVRKIPAVQMVEHRMGQKLPRRRRPNGPATPPAGWYIARNFRLGMMWKSCKTGSECFRSSCSSTRDKGQKTGCFSISFTTNPRILLGMKWAS